MKKSTGVFLLATLLLSACSLNKSVERKSKKALSKAPYDVIIVPGYPYDAPENEELFPIRLYWAKTIYDKGLAKNIIFSGNAVQTPYTEGEIMKLFAVNMGIPEDKIFIESKAEHTNQNIKYERKLAKKLGFKKIAFATDPYQFSYMKTLVFFLANGTPILSFPTDSMSVYNQPLPEINVQTAYVENWQQKK